MFSIIIPLYNKTTYIEKAIRSVLNQTYHEFELIIVDDGSTDNGVLVVEQYLQKQFKEGNNSLSDNVRIVRQANAGVSTTRNNGVEFAKYDYIAFLDADDWWHKHYLSEMKQLIENYPDAGLYSASYYQVNNGHRRKATIGVEPNFHSGYIDYCETYSNTLCMPVWTGATIIPKKIFQAQQGFKASLKLGEDFDLWIRVALQHKVAFLNKPLAFYNHDVVGQNRAVISNRLYTVNEHYIFNLEYLQEEESINSSLKKLLDALRVYVLQPYFLNKSKRENARHELSKVDWEKQPLKERIRIKIPIFFLQLHYKMMNTASKIKQFIKQHR